MEWIHRQEKAGNPIIVASELEPAARRARASKKTFPSEKFKSYIPKVTHILLVLIINTFL
jgi:hypothetical protein